MSVSLIVCVHVDNLLYKRVVKWFVDSVATVMRCIPDDISNLAFVYTFRSLSRSLCFSLSLASSIFVALHLAPSQNGRPTILYSVSKVSFKLCFTLETHTHTLCLSVHLFSVSVVVSRERERTRAHARALKNFTFPFYLPVLYCSRKIRFSSRKTFLVHKFI